MSPAKLANISTHTFKGAVSIIHHGLSAIKRDPQILVYPYLAVLVILITFPLASSISHEIWHRFAHYTDISITTEAPHRLRVLMGLVTFYVFYTGLITAYFTCAVSASVLHMLDGQPTTLFYGLRTVIKHFIKITKFSILAVLFFPLSLVAQRNKLNSFRGIIEVVGSSLSLQMAQLAPAILTENKNVMDTIRRSVDTLGRYWRANLVIKVIMYAIFLLLATASLLPKLVEHYWFDGETSHTAGWLATALLGAASYIVVRVVGTVFTTTLYNKASKDK